MDNHSGQPQRTTTADSHKGQPQWTATIDNHKGNHSGQPQQIATKDNHSGQSQWTATKDNHSGQPKRVTTMNINRTDLINLRLFCLNRDKRHRLKNFFVIETRQLFANTNTFFSGRKGIPKFGQFSSSFELQPFLRKFSKPHLKVAETNCKERLILNIKAVVIRQHCL